MGTIDFSAYISRPRIDAASGVVLTRKLIKAAPKKLSADAKRALRELREAGLEVQKIGVERHRLKPETVRPYDVRWDNGWGGLYFRLKGLARLAGEPEAERASKLLALLFASDDLTMLTLSFEDEWLEGDKLLSLIDSQKLGREIDELAGSVFLRYIRGAQKDLGEALGIGERTIETARTTGMSDALDELATAISDYVRALSGTVDRKDESTVEVFLDAVAPLEAHRAARAARRGSTEEPAPEPTTEDEDPSTPMPPVA